MLRSGKPYGVNETAAAKAAALLANQENQGPHNGLPSPPASHKSNSPEPVTPDPYEDSALYDYFTPGPGDHNNPYSAAWMWASPVTSADTSPVKPPPQPNNPSTKSPS